MEIQYLITLLSGFMIYLCEGRMDREHQCAVCRALVDEMNHGVSLVDPKETIEIGSFRVDPKGNTKTYQRSYARSEVHLMELFEKVCDKFMQYALTKNSKGQKSVIPTSSRSGKSISLKEVTISSDATKQMKYTCEHFVEEYEEDMTKVLNKDDSDNHEKEICLRITGICTVEDLATPMPSPDSPEYQKSEEEVKAEQSDSGDNSDEDDEGDDEDEKEDDSDNVKEEL